MLPASMVVPPSVLLFSVEVYARGWGMQLLAMWAMALAATAATHGGGGCRT